MISETSTAPTREMGDYPVIVRLADGNDLDGVATVGRAAWGALEESLYPPELRELVIAKQWTKAALVPAIRAGRTFVADHDDEIVGMASYGVDRGRLVVWKLHILPEARGHDLGWRLLRAVCERAGEGHDTVMLPITDGNDAGIRFSLRHGFVEDHREQQHGLPDLVWMRSPLPVRRDDRAGVPDEEDATR